MPTITDMQIAKRRLEQDIYLLITDFENEFGVAVESVSQRHDGPMCGRVKTVNVRVDVKI